MKRKSSDGTHAEVDHGFVSREGESSSSKQPSPTWMSILRGRNHRIETDSSPTSGVGENEKKGTFNRPWIGVDLDGTLARYEPGKNPNHIGEPVPDMMQRVRCWLADGQSVKVVTARAVDPFLKRTVQRWLRIHDLGNLEVTDRKDFGMTVLWDDRCIQVDRANSGATLADCLDDLLLELRELNSRMIQSRETLSRLLTTLQESVNSLPAGGMDGSAASMELAWLARVQRVLAGQIEEIRGVVDDSTKLLKDSEEKRSRFRGTGALEITEEPAPKKGMAVE
ncbi:MAG: hypothetical protein JSU96_17685 [Acidobacteriota bacterium]|nr:MAG: hypothetical protein JSU96_17685 [Acidobacteriota bacterium]